MRVRSLSIKNFRGVKELIWNLPAEQRLITLVGAGDTGKSTILDAIHYLLGDRWNIPFADTDFYGVDVTNPIVIKAVLVDLPDAIRRESAFGLWLSGLDANGEVHQDPRDAYTPALIVSLTVDSSLEPKWAAERKDGQTHALTTSHRSHFSTFKVDDRSDTQLRWSRTSSLGRISSRDGGEREALAAASRAAREALADHNNLSLAELATQIQERINSIGSGNFSDIKPGLDTSRSSMGAALALYENVVPLTSFGLGSKRLASLAIQQLAAGNRSIAVVDEIEDGLEPHRAVRLLEYLLAEDFYSQVIVTTHSPVIVEQAQIENLATVTAQDGVLTVTSLGGADERLQRLRRTRPSSFLGRRIVITEGATEHGLLLSCIRTWDEDRSALGLSTSAGEGVALQHGEGGSEVAPRATAFRLLGYDVAGLMDNDDRSVDAAVAEAGVAGAIIFRWNYGFNLETQLVSQLSENELSEFLQLAVARRSSESTVINDLTDAADGLVISSLAVADWITTNTSIDVARTTVAKAAIDKKWFKEVPGGRELGLWLMDHRTSPGVTDTMATLERLHAFIFGDAVPASAAEVSASDEHAAE